MASQGTQPVSYPVRPPTNSWSATSCSYWLGRVPSGLPFAGVGRRMAPVRLITNAVALPEDRPSQLLPSPEAADDFSVVSDPGLDFPSPPTPTLPSYRKMASSTLFCVPGRRRCGRHLHLSLQFASRFSHAPSSTPWIVPRTNGIRLCREPAQSCPGPPHPVPPAPHPSPHRTGA